MTSQYSAEDLVIARMRELVDLRTSWHRALWQVGTIVGLSEIVEAAELTWSGQLTSAEALKDFATGLNRQVSLDHGLGDKAARDRILELIAQLPPKASDAGRGALAALRQMIERSRFDYMSRWARQVKTSPLKSDEVELTARLAIAHLLDQGFHRSHIHGWLANLPHSDKLEDVLHRAQEMLGEGTREFEIFIGLTNLPKEVADGIEKVRTDGSRYLDAFRGASNVSTFTVPREPAAGIKLTFTARDPHSAVADSAAWLQKFVARVAVGTGGVLIRFEELVVDLTTNKIRSFKNEARQVRIPSVQRNNLFALISSQGNPNEQIDDAIGLLAAQQQTSSGPSIASTWAAVEGLLGRAGGGKGVDAADRLADIVACSFPRAELTELARRWEKTGKGPLSDLIKAETNNSAKIALMHAELIKVGDPGFHGAHDVAAAHRLAQLNGSTAETLERVRGYYRSVFRRLYYQRNFIMHAAKFDSVSLPSAIRAAPQLVAAGVDRIVNAQFGSRPVSPLELAARAENELAMIGSSAARPLFALLD